MLHLETATLTIRTATARAALAGIKSYIENGDASGRFCGVFSAEIGALNRIILVRAFDEGDGVLAERARIIESGDFFGASNELIDCTFDTWMPFPFVTPQLGGEFGSVYEFRIYNMRPAGVRPVLAAWEAAVPARMKMSPIVIAAYALDGTTPRMLNVCPYRDANARMSIRNDAAAAGIWPPKGGPDWLTVMDATLCLPASFSPMR
jgi:hypothetical protein